MTNILKFSCQISKVWDSYIFSFISIACSTSVYVNIAQISYYLTLYTERYYCITLGKWMYYLHLVWCTWYFKRCVILHYRQWDVLIHPLWCPAFTSLRHYLPTELGEEATRARSDGARCLYGDGFESIRFADVLVVVSLSLFCLCSRCSCWGCSFWQSSWTESVSSSCVTAQALTMS